MAEENTRGVMTYQERSSTPVNRPTSNIDFGGAFSRQGQKASRQAMERGFLVELEQQLISWLGDNASKRVQSAWQTAAIDLEQGMQNLHQLAVGRERPEQLDEVVQKVIARMAGRMVEGVEGITDVTERRLRETLEIAIRPRVEWSTITPSTGFLSRFRDE